MKRNRSLKMMLLGLGFAASMSCGFDAAASIVVSDAGPGGAPVVGPDPIFNFSFSIGPDSGFGTLNTVDIGGGAFSAIGGSLTVTGGADIGSYSLYPVGPAETISPFGAFAVDDVLYPASNPYLDVWGLLFTGGGLEINIWGNGPDNYSFYSDNGASYTVADELGTHVQFDCGARTGHGFASRHQPPWLRRVVASPQGASVGLE